jgi:hypothetical protein
MLRAKWWEWMARPRWWCQAGVALEQLADLHRASRLLGGYEPIWPDSAAMSVSHCPARRGR